MVPKLYYNQDQRQLTAMGFALIFLNCLQLDAGAGGLCSPILRKVCSQGVFQWHWVLLDHRLMTSKPSQAADLRSRGNVRFRWKLPFFFLPSPNPASTSAFMLDTDCPWCAFSSKQLQFPPLLRTNGCTSFLLPCPPIALLSLVSDCPSPRVLCEP